MTIGLTWRRTARRIKRLKEGVLTISPDYSDRPTPDFLALSHRDGIRRPAALEELVEDQALNADLKQAVMACLCGRESRRWTIGELVERFKNLGIRASRAGVTAA